MARRIVRPYFVKIRTLFPLFGLLVGVLVIYHVSGAFLFFYLQECSKYKATPPPSTFQSKQNLLNICNKLTAQDGNVSFPVHVSGERVDRLLQLCRAVEFRRDRDEGTQCDLDGKSFGKWYAFATALCSTAGNIMTQCFIMMQSEV